MATATLVQAGQNRLRYLITAAGVGSETVNIPSTGGATPDLQTDALDGGILKQLSKVVDDGYGDLFPAGAQTVADARALWLSDLVGYMAALPVGSDVEMTNFLTKPTAICRGTLRTAGAGTDNITIDVGVDGNGYPQIEVTIVGGGTAYVDVEVPGTIGV